MLLLMRRDIVFSLMTFVLGGSGPAGNSLSPVARGGRPVGGDLEKKFSARRRSRPRPLGPRLGPPAGGARGGRRERPPDSAEGGRPGGRPPSLAGPFPQG